MNERLSNRVTFTILSGDGGFREIELQCAKLSRRTIVMNPHKMSDSHLYALIRSIVDK
jgi:hypothetical protein